MLYYFFTTYRALQIFVILLFSNCHDLLRKIMTCFLVAFFAVLESEQCLPFRNQMIISLHKCLSYFSGNCPHFLGTSVTLFPFVFTHALNSFSLENVGNIGCYQRIARYSGEDSGLVPRWIHHDFELTVLILLNPRLERQVYPAI